MQRLRAPHDAQRRRAGSGPGAALLATVTALVAGSLVLAPVATGRAAATEPGLGVIKSVCGYSHTASDDPIVKPGQPGASHSHDFYGSPIVDAFTTLETLQAGGTTCDFAEDPSGYWLPALLKNGTPVIASTMAAYYTTDGADPTLVEPYPEGLRVVAGDASATAPQSQTVTTWRCVDAQSNPIGGYFSAVPTCAAGNSVQLGVRFPECWDGVNLDSANHKSHLAYIGTGGTCPSSHPVLVPSLTVFALYPISNGSGVALSSGGQYSAHSDFFNAWEPTRLRELVEGCIHVEVACTPVELVVADASATEGATMDFDITLSAASPSPVEVDYVTEDVTAVAPADYVAASGHLTFLPGEVSKRVSVTLVDDTLSELTEAFLLRLSNPVNAGLSTETRVASLLDNDAGPAITAHDAIVAEPTSGTVGLFTELTLSTASDRVVTVAYQTVDGTATQPADYQSTSGTVTFPAGVVSKTVGVTVNSDGLFTEGNETLTLLLSSPTDATIADGSAVLTISDPTVVPKLYVDDTTTPESGVASFRVTLSSPTASEVSFDYTTSNGGAIAPLDYVTTSGRKVIPPGASEVTIHVPIVQDSLSEAAETFKLTPSNAANATIITNLASAVIDDDDPLPTLSVGDATVAEPTTGTRTLRFTVSLSTAAGQPVTFNWMTLDWTANAPTDYLAASGSMTFPVGVTSKTITLTVLADPEIEESELVVTYLSGLVGAAGVKIVGVGEIAPG